MQKDKYLIYYINQAVADINGDGSEFTLKTAKEIKEMKGNYGKDFLLYQEIDISDIK